MSELEAFFSPRSVAVIGASRSPGKLGHEVMVDSARLGFSGEMFGVNPASDGTAIAGWPVLRSLEEFEGRVDLAYIALPAGATLEAVRACARHGVRAAVLAASGLGELGGGAGAVEREIGGVARDAGMRLLGPNGFGLFVRRIGLSLMPWARVPEGRVALVTQSGNVAIAICTLMRRAGIGLSSCAGLGNQIDVDVAELLLHHAASDDADAVALYLEGLRARDDERFIGALLACHAAEKPVVVLKAGASTLGAVATATHTGALGGGEALWDRALRSGRAIRVASTEDMTDCLAVLGSLGRSGAGRLRNHGVLVLSDGGGDSVLMLDALDSAGIRLAELTPGTQEALDDLAPPAAPRAPGSNPVTLDTAGGLEEDPRLLARCAEVGSLDESVGTIVVTGTFGGYRAKREEEQEAVDRLAAVHSAVPVVVHSAFEPADEEPIVRLRQKGIAVYPTARRLAEALARVAGPRPASQSGAGMACGQQQPVLPGRATAELLRAAGIRLPPLVFTDRAEDVEKFASEVPGALCLKVDDVNIAHKSDVGGVLLGIERDEIVTALQSLKQRFPAAGLLAMPTLDPGLELVVAVSTDATFGAYVTVGRGGLMMELDPDVAVTTAPCTLEEAKGAWLSLRCGPMLTGWRSCSGVDLDALAELTVKMGQLGSRHPGITIELNPVIAYAAGYAVADFRAAESRRKDTDAGS